MKDLFVYITAMDWVVVGILAAAVILILGLTVRKGYRAALRARQKFEQEAAAPLTSPALDDVEPEEGGGEIPNIIAFPAVEAEEIDELTLAVETVLSRLDGLGKHYHPEELVQIAQDVRDRGGTFTEEESDAYLYRLLEKGAVFTSEQYGVIHSVAYMASELEQYAGYLAARTSAQ